MAELSNALVICLGLGTVFVGLISLILICYVMSALCKLLAGKKNDAPAAASAPVQSVANQPIANKQELVAAVCAAVAEEIGCEAKNIKVTSFKRV